jgi:hypothetical protein
MAAVYEAEVYSFNGQPARRSMTYLQAVEYVGRGEAVAVLLDMLDPEGLDAWWAGSAFPDIVRHRNFPTAGVSGIPIGGVQRLENGNLVLGLIDYFSYAARVNDRLRESEFVKLCRRELGAESVRIGAWGELPLASRREFVRNDSGPYSVPPHCDAIHFGRDRANWPFRSGFSEDGLQVSTVLMVNEAENDAGIVFWDLKPETRPELDALMAEVSGPDGAARLRDVPSVTVRARAGQMTVLDTRRLHAVEQCASPRRTIGCFLIRHDGCWRMFH